MTSKISLRSIDVYNARALAYLLSYDNKLRSALGNHQDRRMVSLEEFLKNITEWQQRTHSRSYTVVLEDEAIGLISLSHMDGTTARIGYWLSSNQWCHGYATRAFSMVLKIAKELGVKTVKATIEPTNLASIRIWQNKGAHIDKHGDQLEVTLDI